MKRVFPALAAICWRLLRLRGRAAACWPGLLLCWLAACGGGSAPRDQAADPQAAEFNVTLGPGANTVNVTLSAKGATGLLRTTAPLPGGAPLLVSAVDLTAPYMLFGNGSAAVSLQSGRINLTELTRLQAEVLFGSEDLAGAFADFGNGSEVTTQATQGHIDSAQARVVDFVQDVLGVPVASGSASFVTTPFESVAGDSMFDTLTALNARIKAIGTDAYAAQVTALVDEARRCNTEKLGLALPAGPQDFCPASKTTTAERQDHTVLDYVFTSQAGARLTVRLRGDGVLTARYVSAGGSPAYGCTAEGCTGLTVAAVAADGTRSLTFDQTALLGNGSRILLTGTLTGAAPGVVLPTLPCSDNRFFLVLPDRSVVADCVSDPGSALGLTGTFGTQQGGTDYANYPFYNFDGSGGLPASDAPAIVSMVLDGGSLISITVTRTDPTSGALTLDYKCRGASCTGVTIGPATLNSDSGFNAYLRRITLAGTPLARVQADGTLSTDPGAVLSGSFNGIYISSADFGYNPPVLAAQCTGFAETVRVAPANEANVYGICPEGVGFTAPSAGTTPTANGGLRISFPATPAQQAPGNPPPAYDYLVVTTDGTGRIASVNVDQTGYQGSSLGETFGCSGNCVGVSLSAADGAGMRQLVFDNTLVHVIEADSFATDARTATLSGSFAVPPPSP